MATALEPSTSPWTPLRLPLFRHLWIASLVSNVGTVMHTVGASWAATDLTDSPTLIGLVQTAWAVPGFLVALHAGALADVVDRRRLVVVCQLAAMALAGALAVLQWVDALGYPLLLVCTFLLSVVLTLVAPAFMAIIPELVDGSGPAELGKAIGLSAISQNIAQSLGPAVAGVVIAVSGAGAVFALNAVSFLGIVVAVRGYRHRRDPGGAVEPVGTAVRTGVDYVRRSPRLPGLAARVALAMVVTSSLVALLPVVARRRLDVSAAQFGVLSAALGAGAVLAIWSLPHLRRRWGADAVVVLAASCWAAGAALFATTTVFGVAVLGLAMGGAGSMATLNVVFTTYTALLPPWVRGRASSMVMLVVWLGTSVGAVGWGAVASATSPSTSLVTASITHVVVTLVATRWLPVEPSRVDSEVPAAPVP